MTEEEKRKLVLSFLRKHTLAVISTLHRDNTPEAAVVDFSVRDNLELLFDTFQQTRKYPNILQKNDVAFVIGWDENITVQYEGKAIRIPDHEVEKYQKEHIERVPFEKQFIERGAVIFKVVPRWIRYSDFTKDPTEFIEISF